MLSGTKRGRHRPRDHHRAHGLLRAPVRLGVLEEKPQCQEDRRSRKCRPR
nr:MAG TPA: hypothetical protein [Caudoviricetes sp.]